MKEVLREITGGEVVLLKKFFSEPVVSELENNLEIMLLLSLPPIILEDSDFPRYKLSLFFFFNLWLR